MSFYRWVENRQRNFTSGPITKMPPHYTHRLIALQKSRAIEESTRERSTTRWVHVALLKVWCILQPCSREITLGIPDEYVSRADSPNELFDGGVLQLQFKFDGEDHKCLWLCDREKWSYSLGTWCTERETFTLIMLYFVYFINLNLYNYLLN